MPIESWEKTKGKDVNYLYLHSHEVVIGHNYGSGQTDNAGTSSIKKFLEGQFQDLIIEKFGNKVLEEILLLIKQKISGDDKK